MLKLVFCVKRLPHLSRADFQRYWRPAGRAASVALLEDERRFIDLAASPLFVGEEHEIIAGAR